MTVVLDASVVVAALVDDARHGRWAVGAFDNGALAAPHLLPVEATSMLRRHVAAGALTPAAAVGAHADLAAMPVQLFAFDPFADRVWALRENLTAYDAWYVALAESLDAPLVTLDRRLARSPGPTCQFLTPPG